jgi:release factor glutamine methyltransferase
VGEALQAARARLQQVSQTPRRDAEMILSTVLGWNPTAVMTHTEHVLTTPQEAQFEGLVARRVACEPMQYILGSQEFFGLSFAVTPDVLIPRPETEHLVEAALERIPVDANVSILDVGTGSGAIAIAIAQARPQAKVTAVDLYPAALAVARDNAGRNQVERIRFLQSDLLVELAGARFDLIISNPPYIADEDKLETQVAAFEPHTALFAGPTGLEIYERLIPQAREALHPGGWLLLEIGFGQKDAIARLLANWQAVEFVPDLQGIPRVALANLQG